MEKFWSHLDVRVGLGKHPLADVERTTHSWN
jgi:hypothetical protein